MAPVSLTRLFGTFCHFIMVGETNEPRLKKSYFPLYWLMNRDPYNALLQLQSLYNPISLSFPLQPNQPGALFSLLKSSEISP